MNVKKDLLLWHYSVIPEKLHHDEIGEYQTYGVQLKTSEHTEVLHDVSVDKEKVENIVKMLNCYQVSPIHLYDVLVDLLGETEQEFKNHAF